MISPDLTIVLERYCEWDYIVRNKYLRYVSALLKQHHQVTCRNVIYHNVEDLKVDLEAECYEQSDLED